MFNSLAKYYYKMIRWHLVWKVPEFETDKWTVQRNKLKKKKKKGLFVLMIQSDFARHCKKQINTGDGSTKHSNKSRNH